MRIHITQTQLMRGARRAMRSSLLVLFLGVVGMTACEDTLVPNLNDPIIDDFRDNPSNAEVGAMALGLVFGSRADIGPLVRNTEIIARDAYNLDPADPRWVDQFLGPNLDKGGFGANHWLARYRNIKGANILIEAVETSAEYDATEKSATKGFARTIKGLDLMYLWETRNANGIASDAARDVDDLQPIVCSPGALTRIAAVLDSAYAELQGGGASFPFIDDPIAGFESFSTPATFARFNRALKAKVQVYRGQYADALVALGQSFISTDPAALDAGPKFAYSLGAGDIQNPLFQDVASTNFRVHRSVVTQAEAGDRRVAEKVATGELRTWPSEPGVTSEYVFTVYAGPTSPIPIILNEELILLRAEARWFSGDKLGAIQDINFIRQNAGGLGPTTVSILSSDSAFVDELLRQKRYSLLWESSSRWVDARRFNRLSTLPRDAATHIVHPAFPIPESEELARGGQIACQ
jgi:starch-binding outer membrane protein, SusD/RagB family